MKSNLPESPYSSNPSPVIHYAMQLLALAILLVWCFNILEPFIIPIIWAAVFASTFSPIHEKLTQKLNWKNGLSATVITLAALGILIVPAVYFMLAGAGEIKELAQYLRENEVVIPSPNEKVKSWPLVGEKLFEFWTDASSNLTAALKEHQDQLKPVLLKLIDLIKNTAKGVLLLTISIIISGVMLAYEKEGADFLKKLFVKLAGKGGGKMAGVA